MISIFKYCCLTGLMLLLAGHVFSQDKQAMEKIESARIALITERLGLTPDQAEKFWPVYNEYLNMRRGLQDELVKQRQQVNMENLSEEQSKRLMDFTMDIKQRQLDLEKVYSQRLAQVISAQQMLSLRNAEEDFRRMIIERLEERKMQQMRREQMMQRREEIMKDRGNN